VVLRTLDQIIQRFDATISALFFGHTHQDEFQLAYSTPAKPSWQTATMMSYIAPALTPTSGNPTFRVYSVDPVTFGVLDYTVYYTNLTSPNFQTSPTWSKLYSVRDSYGPLVTPPLPATSELSPAFWHNLTTVFENDDQAFDLWYWRRGRGFSNSTCIGDCKTGKICGLRASQSQYNCQNVTAGIHFRKRDEDSTGYTTSSTHTGECDGSAIIPILNQYYGAGMQDFWDALVKQLGSEWLQSEIPQHWTVEGWNNVTATA